MHFLAVMSMKNRALIALVTVVAAVFGALALTGLKQELAPSIQFPQLAIVTQYPGASPAVVNHDVSTPIEKAVQGVPGLESTSATSSTNRSLVTAKFTYGSDLDTAEQKIDHQISLLSSSLPDGVDPQVVSGSIDDLPVLQFAVTAHGADADTDTSALADRIEKVALPEIKKVDGVRDASLIGARGHRVTITPDEKKLAAAGLTTQDIRHALQDNGTLVPGGEITEDGKTLTVQAGSKLDSVKQLAALPLTGAAAPGAPPTLGDVATVKQTTDPRTSISRVDGKPALTVAVTKLPDANTVDVSSAVHDILPKLEGQLDGASFTTVFDQAPYIQDSISSLAEEGLLGLLFAVIVILVFLMSIRSTLVTAISIPTSVLITFIAMQSADYTLNIITLGALTIAIGRVVDDSIVVIENIKRHLERAGDRARSAVIVEAVREVAGAITASTATTVAVFLPIAFVGGMTGELFRPFALTITIALAASLLVALTIVPVLAYWFLRARSRRHAGAHDAHEAEAQAGAAEPVTRLQRGYLPVIRWTLRHGVVTILLAVLVLAGTLALVPAMKTNFLGSSGQNTFTVTQTLERGASLDAQDDAARKVEKALRGVDGVKTFDVTIGSGGGALSVAFGGGDSGAVTFSVTTQKDADQEAIQSAVRKRLEGVHGAGEISLASSSGFGASDDIEVDVTAPDRASLEKASERILHRVRGLDDVTQAESNLSASLPYIAVSVDRKKAAEAGLTELQVGQIVSQATQPTQVGTIAIDDTTEKIYLASPKPPTTTAALAALSVPTSSGPVRLDSLATVKRVKGPATITTVNALHSATITATPAGDNVGAASAEVAGAVDAVHLPRGATASLGGVTSDQNQAFQQLGLALLAAILIVYIVMVATFRSLLQPLLLLVSVPFAATGALLLQILTGVPLGVASLVGVLMLVGIVVTNAIVLVDLVNQYRRRGLAVREAVVEGSRRRLRPILMTALATIFALTPMAIGVTGSGGFISQPLALVVIGGLVSSTFLTLVVLPTLYALVEGARERRAARPAARP